MILQKISRFLFYIDLIIKFIYNYFVEYCRRKGLSVISNSRLKIMRKISRKTQSDIARVVNITQNAYSYWENGKVNIDSESLKKLANYYNVSLDFLSGREFTITVPVEHWSKEQQEIYYTSNEEKKIYLEYLWGAPVFLDTLQAGADELSLASEHLSEHEKNLLAAYRAQPHMQAAVDRLLGVNEDGDFVLYQAAKSDDNRAPRIIQKTKEDWEAILNAPETDDPLI